MKSHDSEASSRQLSRSLQPRHVAMITIGGIIGAGLFVGSSAAIVATGPAVAVSYALAGLIMLLVMRMIGEMATALPSVRAFTEFARAGLGDWGGFVTGWLYWYFWVIVIPIEAIAGAKILEVWIPLPAWQIGLALMAMLTGVNLMSARSYAEFEFWFSSIKVAAIIVFMILAASYAFGFTSGHGPTFSNLVDHGGFMPRGPVAVLAGTIAAFFSMSGSEIVTIAAAESREPQASVAKMTTGVLFRVSTFFVGSIFLIVSVVPWTTVKVGESPFTAALQGMGFHWGNLLMQAVILTAVLSCLNSAFYICSRVLFVLAEKGDAPASMVELNRRHVPARSVLIAAFFGVLGVLAAALSPARVFALLVNSAGGLMLFVYIIVSVAHVRMRRARERAGAPPPPILMWAFPWASYAAIGAMFGVLLAMSLTPGLSRDLQLSLVTLTIIVGVQFVRSRRRRRALASVQT